MPKLPRPKLPRPKLPPAPIGVRVWAFAVRRRHWRVLVSHPHHYVTAAGMTGFLFLVGHFEAAAVVGAWGYALVENLATAAEGEILADDAEKISQLVENL